MDVGYDIWGLGYGVMKGVKGGHGVGKVRV